MIRRVRNPDTKEFEDAIYTPCVYGPVGTLLFQTTNKTFLENAMDEFGGFEEEKKE